jgi:hypothetical protein
VLNSLGVGTRDLRQIEVRGIGDVVVLSPDRRENLRRALSANDLPFSGERRTGVQVHHGREEPRAQPAAAQLTFMRVAQAFIRCNGLLATL